MVHALKSAAAGLGAAVLTFIILIILALEGIYSVATGTALGLPLVMGFLVGQSVWKGSRLEKDGSTPSPGTESGD